MRWIQLLGRELVEREELVEVVGDLRDRLGLLGVELVREHRGGSQRVVAVFGVADLGEHLLCRGPLTRESAFEVGHDVRVGIATKELELSA